MKDVTLTVCSLCLGVVVRQFNGPLVCSSCFEQDPPTENMHEYELQQALKIDFALRNPKPKVAVNE